MTVCPGALTAATPTSPSGDTRSHRSRTSSSVGPMTLAMPPGRCFDHFAMIRPRSATSLSASGKEIASAAAAAENCPKLCPETCEGKN